VPSFGISVLFNGTDLSDLIVVDPDKITGRGPLYQVITMQDISGRRNGSYFVRKKRPSRTLGVPFTLIGKSNIDKRQKVDELNNILYVPEPSSIVFEDESDKTYYGIIDGVPDWNEIVETGQGILPFTCPDPNKYGPSKTLTMGVSEGDTVVTLFADQASEYADYGAPVSALPVFNVTFDNPSSEYKITHVESGKYVRVIYDFVAGDTLIIDHKTRKITINDVTHMTALDWANSEFFELVTGNNHFTITDGVANTDITYIPRWL
jgi:predicted phage tail component-like protein